MWMELLILYVYGKCRILFNDYVRCFVNLNVEASFQLTTGLIGVSGLCNIMVARKFGALQVHVHVYSYFLLACYYFAVLIHVL
jgi:hypothetical protein